jgi:hypothetical protein
MTERSVHSVRPLERFRVRVSGRLRKGPWDVKFDRKSRYYCCPKCSARTFIRWQRLDIFNPPSSPFPPELRGRFDEEPESQAGSTAALDFYCKGCREPVRLLFRGQERGMGGWWYGSVTSVLELDEPE